MLEEELQNRGRSSTRAVCWCDVFEERKVLHSIVISF